MFGFGARQEFETFMEDSKLDVAGKEKDVEHKSLGRSGRRCLKSICLQLFFDPARS